MADEMSAGTEPLTEDQLIEIERRARWLSTSESKQARREDGEVMLQLIAELRLLRESQAGVDYATPAIKARVQEANLLSPEAMAAIEAHLDEPNTDPALILQDARRLLAEVRELQASEISLIRSALFTMREEHQLSFDELPSS